MEQIKKQGKEAVTPSDRVINLARTPFNQHSGFVKNPFSRFYNLNQGEPGAIPLLVSLFAVTF